MPGPPRRAGTPAVNVTKALGQLWELFDAACIRVLAPIWDGIVNVVRHDLFVPVVCGLWPVVYFATGWGAAPCN